MVKPMKLKTDLNIHSRRLFDAGCERGWNLFEACQYSSIEYGWGSHLCEEK
jgi:hypothetical protein